MLSIQERFQIKSGYDGARKVVISTFLVSIEEFYLVLKENKKKFVDSEFVKKCLEHVTCTDFRNEQKLGNYILLISNKLFAIIR